MWSVSYNIRLLHTSKYISKLHYLFVTQSTVTKIQLHIETFLLNLQWAIT